MIARKLTQDKRIVCASPDYIEQFGAPRTPKELNKHNCITLMGLEHWSFKDGNNIVSVKTTGNFRTDNGEAIRDACINGMGLTINSTWSAYKHLETGELVQVLEDYPLASQTAIWAVYPSSRLLAAKVRAFIDYFVEYFGDVPYWDQSLSLK